MEERQGESSDKDGSAELCGVSAFFEDAIQQFRALPRLGPLDLSTQDAAHRSLQCIEEAVARIKTPQPVFSALRQLILSSHMEES